MEKVFMPINLRMEDIIIANSHLIDGNNIPKCFKVLLAHIETYKAVIEKWEKNPPIEQENFENLVLENTARLNFPDDFDQYVSEVFVRLKEKQAILMGR